MIEAKRAPVRPRVYSESSSTLLLLEDEVRAFAEAGARGGIAILGPAGSGKTTALQHLRSILPPARRATFLDEPNLSQLSEVMSAPIGLVIYTAQADRLAEPLAAYWLAPWSRDDLIEYLLAVHRPHCAAVMARIRPADHFLIGGIAELWRIALDRLAGDDELPDVRRALHRHLQDHLADTDLLERARSACLNTVLTPEAALADALIGLARPGFADSLIRLLRHPAMQMMLASERIVADLHGEAGCDFLAKRLPRDLVEATGRLLAAHTGWMLSQDRPDGLVEATRFPVGGDERARAHLRALLAGPPWSHAMAASLLHAAGASAELRNGCPRQLAGAYLEGISWAGVNLEGADITETDLTAANLGTANLDGAIAQRSVLQSACLSEASLNEVVAIEADLSKACLTHIYAYRAQFDRATLESSDLSGSVLEKASFGGATLRRASFRDTDLTGAILCDAELEEADFAQANLTRADLTDRCLRIAHWEGACFRQAQLDECDLEYMNLPDAHFEKASLRGALLTGSMMHRANFRGACLHNAGLADIEWEGADLRGADLRGASFHMGSTRSGLVGSTIPCEGSRTGFYTDDYDEQTYKAPEEIRKANLCGADLRGAILEGVDFYLVDLRGALYDEKDEEHLRRCGAILEARV